MRKSLAYLWVVLVMFALVLFGWFLANSTEMIAAQEAQEAQEAEEFRHGRVFSDPEVTKCVLVSKSLFFDVERCEDTEAGVVFYQNSAGFMFLLQD